MDKLINDKVVEAILDLIIKRLAEDGITEGKAVLHQKDSYYLLHMPTTAIGIMLDNQDLMLDIYPEEEAIEIHHVLMQGHGDLSKDRKFEYDDPDLVDTIVNYVKDELRVPKNWDSSVAW